MQVIPIPRRGIASRVNDGERNVCSSLDLTSNLLSQLTGRTITRALLAPRINYTRAGIASRWTSDVSVNDSRRIFISPRLTMRPQPRRGHGSRIRSYENIVRESSRMTPRSRAPRTRPAGIAEKLHASSVRDPRQNENWTG